MVKKKSINVGIVELKNENSRFNLTEIDIKNIAKTIADLIEDASGNIDALDVKSEIREMLLKRIDLKDIDILDLEDIETAVNKTVRSIKEEINAGIELDMIDIYITQDTDENSNPIKTICIEFGYVQWDEDEDFDTEDQYDFEDDYLD